MNVQTGAERTMAAGRTEVTCVSVDGHSVHSCGALPLTEMLLLVKEGQGGPGRVFWREHVVIFLVHFKSVTDPGRGESRRKSGSSPKRES